MFKEVRSFLVIIGVLFVNPNYTVAEINAPTNQQPEAGDLCMTLLQSCINLCELVDSGKPKSAESLTVLSNCYTACAKLYDWCINPVGVPQPLPLPNGDVGTKKRPPEIS